MSQRPPRGRVPSGRPLLVSQRKRWPGSACKRDGHDGNRDDDNLSRCKPSSSFPPTLVLGQRAVDKLTEYRASICRPFCLLARRSTQSWSAAARGLACQGRSLCRKPVEFHIFLPGQPRPFTRGGGSDISTSPTAPPPSLGTWIQRRTLAHTEVLVLGLGILIPFNLACLQIWRIVGMSNLEFQVLSLDTLSASLPSLCPLQALASPRKPRSHHVPDCP